MAAPVLSLVCLPFAGSGAAFFREWKKDAPEGIEVVPLQLPGREERFMDEPFTDLGDAADELTPGVADAVGDGPFALFGHSMGALLAYEIARRLDEAEGPRPVRLFVSGSPGPGSVRSQRATGLDDDAFLKQVREFAGYQHAALDDPDLREVLLPLLRADVAMHENYVPGRAGPLGIPVTALRGLQDTLVSAEQALEWEDHTSADFQYAELPGGHMYLADGAALLLRVVATG